jgi:uncharacterized protein (TIGR02996 family)
MTLLKAHLVFPTKSSLQTATDLVVNGLDVHTIANSWNRSTLMLGDRAMGDTKQGITQVHITNLKKRDLRTKFSGSLEGLVVEGDTWIAGSAGGLYRSEDAGVTWRFEALPTKDPVVSIARWEDALWIACGCGWLGRQANGEETWKEITRPEAPTIEKMTYGSTLPYTRAVNSRLKVALGALYVVGQEGLWRLAKDGCAAEREIDDEAQLVDMTETSKGTLLASGLDNALWRRPLGEKSWSRVPAIKFGPPDDTMTQKKKIGCVALVALGDEIVLVLNRAGTGKSPLLVSNDDGLSFEPFAEDLEIEEKPFADYLKDCQLRTAVADGQGGALISGGHGLLLRVSPEGGLGPFGKAPKKAATKKSAKAIKEENRNPSPLVAKKKDAGEEEKLVGEVIASPDDDAPRLVYADWLTEHGDSRGEFIQLQCTLAKGDETRPGQPHPDHQQMLTRVGELMKKYEREWLAPVRLYFYAHTWSRGFLHWVKSNPKFFPGAEKVFASHPIVRLTLEGMKKKSDLDAFGEMPFGQTVRWLNVSEQRIGPDKVHVLLGERLSHIEWLMLWANPLGDEGAKALAEKSHLKNLKRLSFLSCGIGDEGVEALASSPILEGVERLNLRGNKLTNKGLEALIASPYLKNAYDVAVRDYRADEFDEALLAKLQARLSPGNADDRWEPY